MLEKALRASTSLYANEEGFWVMRKKVLLAIAVVLALGHSSARADKVILDVSQGATLPGTAAQGGLFYVSNTEIQPTGSGVIDPFLTIQQDGQERGFNTNVPNQLDNKRENAPGPPGKTRSVQLGEIGSVTIDNVEYLQFLLDVNQTGNNNLSLNQVQFFVSSDPLGPGFTLTEASSTNNAVIDFGSAGQQVFQMSSSNVSGVSNLSNEVQIDSSHGSGSGDMFLYVQKSLFGSNPDAYVTLFSQFGDPNGTYASNDGFEEWAFRQSTSGPAAVPEPGTVALALTGAFGFGLAGLRRFRRRVAQ